MTVHNAPRVYRSLAPLEAFSSRLLRYECWIYEFTFPHRLCTFSVPVMQVRQGPHSWYSMRQVDRRRKHGITLDRAARMERILLFACKRLWHAKWHASWQPMLSGQCKCEVLCVCWCFLSIAFFLVWLLWPNCIPADLWHPNRWSSHHKGAKPGQIDWEWHLKAHITLARTRLLGSNYHNEQHHEVLKEESCGSWVSEACHDMDAKWVLDRPGKRLK